MRQDSRQAKNGNDADTHGLSGAPRVLAVIKDTRYLLQWCMSVVFYDLQQNEAVSDRADGRPAFLSTLNECAT
ncbi:MAG: hypothetical protein IT497_07205 [Ottowia sp.]|jgi:hypothetical protein|nr:hypothetical protein [Ottowia sp.]